jgi:hypothetical protein
VHAALGDSPTPVEADVDGRAALGAIPNIEWLEGSGLTLQPRRGLRRDLQAAPSTSGAAGDVAAWPHPMADGEAIRDRALDQRRRAGRRGGAQPARRAAALRRRAVLLVATSTT